MKPYSNDLRQKVIRAYNRGEGTLRSLAARFSVSSDFVWRLSKRFRAPGSVEPKPHGGGQSAKLQGEALNYLRQLVEANPDATLSELREQLYCSKRIEVSNSTVCRALQKLGLPRKKKTFHASERDQDEDIQQERAHYEQQMPTMRVERLIFVDETSINLSLTRLYARALIGKRAEAHKPFNRSQSLSVVDTLSIAGVTSAMIVDGAIDGDTFCGFLEQFVVPTLREGDSVVMDHLKAHTVQNVEPLITATGAILQYLPRYSPELSPIEHCWSKMKTVLRSIAARTRETLIQGVKKALEEVTENDAKGWFKHCGYCT